MNLLITGALRATEEELDAIRSIGYDIIWHQDEKQPLPASVAGVEAVVCNALFVHHDIALFPALKFIQLTSAGLDRVPLGEIRRRGIRLETAGAVYAPAMAEWVVLKILELYKCARHFHRAQAECSWRKRRDLLELSGKTAVIVGLGAVGREVARRLTPFGVNLLAVEPRALAPGDACLVGDVFKPDRLEEALACGDIVVLCLPLTGETRGLFDRSRLAAMKDSAVLVNVSRGALLDEPALLECLAGGKFRGIALDVFNEEPLPSDSLLWDIERVLVTPHNSFVSDRVGERLFNLIVENLAQYAVGEKARKS